MTQHSHYWAYTQRKSQFKKTHAPQCSLQHYIQTEARTWKLPKCPSIDEWMKKTWYIYTMEYYSAIKRNEFEIVGVRCMNLELVKQSEVSQKQKNKYCILIHLCGIQKNSTNEPICRKGMATQTQRMDLWAQRGRRGQEKLRKWYV